MIDLKRRWKTVMVGAALGLLAGALIEALDIPLGPLDLPPLVLLVGAGCGAIVALLGWGRAAGWAAAAAALVIATVMTTPAVDGAVSRWVRNDPELPGPVDAVVVLSAGITREGRVTDVGLERLVHGLGVARRAGAHVLITTWTTFEAATSRADQHDLLATLGDTAKWREVGPVWSTRDEVLRTAEILPPSQAKRIAVVTSALHSRRACAAFEAAGYRVSCWPAPSRTYSIHQLRAGMSRWGAFRDLVYERLATAKYRLRGWVGR